MGPEGQASHCQWQEQMSRYPDCPLVFHPQGERIKDLRGSWSRACKDAKLADKIPHDFGRTAVRNLVRGGVPERVAMMITGHKTRDVFERYNIVSAGDLEEAAKRIDERIAAKTVTNLGTTPLVDGIQPAVSR